MAKLFPDSGLLGIGIRRLNEQVFEHLDEFMSRHTYIYKTVVVVLFLTAYSAP